MPDFAQWTELDTQTADVATATHAAIAGQQHYVTGVSFSSSAESDSPLSVQLKAGDTVLLQWEIPAEAVAPFSRSFVSPVRIPTNTAATVTVGAASTGVQVSVSIEGYTIRA